MELGSGLLDLLDILIVLETIITLGQALGKEALISLRLSEAPGAVVSDPFMILALWSFVVGFS